MTFLKKILLVDHESALTEFIRDALESTGRFLVKVERDENVAVHSAPWFMPDLILIDGPASSSAGGYLTSRSSLQNTPMLFLSAADFTTQRVAARGTLGGYDFDTGSMPVGDLAGWVEELIESNHAPDPVRAAR